MEQNGMNGRTRAPVSVFEEVRQTVSLPRAAEHLNLSADRSGKVLCPFHGDRHPSMKLYEDHFYCFSCGEHGDAVKLASRVWGVRPYEAALRLIGTAGKTAPFPPPAPRPRRWTAEEDRVYDALTCALRFLKQMEAAVRPQTEDAPTAAYAAAARAREQVELMVEAMADGTAEDRAKNKDYFRRRLGEVLTEYLGKEIKEESNGSK